MAFLKKIPKCLFFLQKKSLGVSATRIHYTRLIMIISLAMSNNNNNIFSLVHNRPRRFQYKKVYENTCDIAVRVNIHA